MAYMVLYMHSVPLYLGHFFIKLKKNFAKNVHFLTYYTYETKEHISIHVGKSVRSGSPCLTSYIITQ